jgi:poly-gamma-glutamate capsule biosynthesis protein CapA/YwtB (metallophosphatase superfamily)
MKIQRRTIIKWLLTWLAVCLLSACQPGVRAGELVDSPTPAADLPTQVPTLAVTQPAAASATPLPTATGSPSPTPRPSPTEVPEITLLFTGQIVPGRCVQAGVEAHGDADYIYAAVRDLIASADLAIGTVNGTISDYSPKTGCVQTFVLTGSSEHADAIQRAGFDAVSVATNHIKNCGSTNCGDRAFYDTLENLRRVGVTPIGAGENLAEALEPVFFEIKGVRFGIVSLGEIEPLAFASEDGPGIAVLNDANLRSAILAARQQADVVIVMPHWGPEYSAIPNWNQRGYARIAVEAGADLVVGNHTHVVQGVQEIEGVPVFYGLGNFVFDQTWAVENTQSVMLIVRFRGRELVGTELIPVMSARDGELRLADGPEAEDILSRIAEASQNLH